MITKFPVASSMAILAIGLLLGSAPATASKIPESDSLTVYDGSGAVLFSVSATEDQESDDPGRLFYISPKDLSSFSDAANIYLCDPNGKISDEFGIFKLDDSYSKDSWSSDGWSWGSNGNQDQYVLGFISDPADFDVKCGKSITCVPESTGVFPGNATLFLSDKLQDKGWTATFISDIEAVPEPATTGLFFGIGALGLCIWKRRTAA